MSGEGWLDVLLQERTVRLLLLPFGTVIVTLTMTSLSEILQADGTKPLLFISYGMNNVSFEPWALWLPRYYLWHLLIFSLVSFKRRALPQGAGWVGNIAGLLVLAEIWTMNTQWPVAKKLLFGVHLFAGLVMIGVAFLETVVVWQPHPAVTGLLVLGGVSFVGVFLVNREPGWALPDSGIPGIQNRWDIVVQWCLFALYLFINWYRYPKVEADMLRGDWRPYLPTPLANLLFGRPPWQPAKYDIEGSNSDLRVFFEERTVRMLVCPLGTLCVTAAMTVLAVRESGGEEQRLFLTNAMNSGEVEPWSVWVPRYFLWHVLIFSLASFKRRALPDRASWVSDFTASTLLIVLWSGYIQTTTPLPPRLMLTMHLFFGGVALTFLVVETVVVWWPHRAFAMLYVLLLAMSTLIFALQEFSEMVTIPDTGIPWIGNRIEILFQWAIAIMHCVVVWYRFPKVEVQMMNGVWGPYLPEPLAKLFFGNDSRSYKGLDNSGFLLVS